MIKVDVKLTGDITAAFDKLSAALGEATLRATAFAGAKVILDEAKHNAAPSVKTGTILRNIIIKRAEEKSKGNELQTYLVTVRAGQRGEDGDAYYWRWVENGHKYVKPKPKKVSWRAHRDLMDVEYGNSRVPAHPFLRPAYDSKKQEALEAMKKSMAEKFKTYLAGGGS